MFPVPEESRGPSRLRPTVPKERSPTAADARPLVLFIGDSYTEGRGSAEMSYGCRAVAQMGWLCDLSAMGGTGYISGGPANRWVDQYAGKSLSFSERIPHLAAKYDPAVVVLDGGRNDEFPPRKDVFARDGIDHRGGTPHLAGRADRLHTAQVSGQSR